MGVSSGAWQTKSLATASAVVEGLRTWWKPATTAKERLQQGQQLAKHPNRETHGHGMPKCP